MELVKLGDVVVLKRDVGEPTLACHIVKLDGTTCAISPWIEMKLGTIGYVKNEFISGDGLPILVHRNELASVCCINSDLTDLFCRSQEETKPTQAKEF